MFLGGGADVFTYICGNWEFNVGVVLVSLDGMLPFLR